MTRCGRRFAGIGLFALLGGLSACTVFRRPEVAFRGVEVRAFGSDGTKLEASFDVTNPNSYGIGVERLTYRITVNGLDAGGGSQDLPTALPPKATTLVRLPLALDWTKLRGSGWDFLSMGRIDYAVEGEITFSTPVGVFTRPYRHTGQYSLFDRSDGSVR
jgi:LEA14-like dessication related protein